MLYIDNFYIKNKRGPKSVERTNLAKLILAPAPAPKGIANKVSWSGIL